jgi:hypothetical protein
MSTNSFEDRALFAGEIVDQTLSMNRNGELQVITSVRLTEEFHGGKPVACDVSHCDVYITAAADETRQRIARDQLELLDFTDRDLTRLHPDHPQSVSLIGRKVTVRARVKGEATYWNFARNRPRPIDFASAQAAVAKLAGLQPVSDAPVTDQPKVSPPTVSY